MLIISQADDLFINPYGEDKLFSENLPNRRYIQTDQLIIYIKSGKIL